VLRDGKTTSTAERIRRPPQGGDTAPRPPKAAEDQRFIFILYTLSRDRFKTADKKKRFLGGELAEMEESHNMLRGYRS
jgi:hypothetical protein